MKCIICGNQLEGTRAGAKYCSRECSRVAERQKQPLTTCAKCGKEFKADKPDRKYCSHLCFTTAQIGHTHSPKKRIIKNCVACGKEFEAGGRLGRQSREFCSWECRYKGRYRMSKAANTLSPLDAAYIAGFLDGEGSFLLYMRRDVAAVRITATNTNRAVIEWLKEVCGVGIIVKGKTLSDKHRLTWHWNCNSESAELVLRQIRPYLKIKTEQADFAMTVQEKLRDPAQKADRSWQKEAHEHMKFLNRTGPRPEIESVA